MRMLLALFMMISLGAGAARAQDVAGEFDYYVLALSWSPGFCDREGEARGNPQCDRPLGWVLHGLWPQYEQGWPSDCRSRFRNPSRAETGAMADIMGSGGSAWHQWQKHGRCTGLSSEDYFALSRLAYDRVNRPAILRQLDRAVTLPPKVIEDAFLKDNPDWAPDMLTITCKAGQIQEARLCLTRNLTPRRCGADVIRDCRMPDALFLPIE